MIKRFLAKAQTPDERFGSILIIGAVSVIILTMIHWNIFKSPFAYRHTVYERIWNETPDNPGEGYFWRRDLTGTGWHLIDEVCDKEIKDEGGDKYGEFLSVLTDRCSRKFVEAKKKFACYDWRFSFVRFFEESVGIAEFIDMKKRWSGYFWFNMPALIALAIGLVMYLGTAKSIARWIKHGSSYKLRPNEDDTNTHLPFDATYEEDIPQSEKPKIRIKRLLLISFIIFAVYFSWNVYPTQCGFNKWMLKTDDGVRYYYEKYNRFSGKVVERYWITLDKMSLKRDWDGEIPSGAEKI